jgi:hypothetical protein
MSKYAGADLDAFAEAVQQVEEEFTGVRDWSIDIAYHLAKAKVALEKLKEEEIQTTYRGKKLVEKQLELAWRELIFIRRRFVPEEYALNDIFRPVTLTKRTGQVMINDTKTTGGNSGKRSSGKGGASSEVRQTTYRRKNPPRYRHRIIRKRDS